MKILLLDWKSFGREDIISAFEKLGHTVITYPFSQEEVRHHVQTEAQLTREIEKHSPDFIFTYNYYPIIASVCHRLSVPYISWVYDSPYVLLYSYTVIHPTNYIFVFDKELYLEFHNAGIQTVHYLPMAANAKRLSRMCDFNALHNSLPGNETSIAFVGSLYTEKHQFYNRLTNISPYTRGYLEGLMAAQLQVYGYNFIQDMLTPDIIADLQHALPMQPSEDGIETVEYLYAQYVINRQITALERTKLLSAIGSRHAYDLYTPDKSVVLPGCVNHGPIDHYSQAPYVFKNAKINLNISLRSIKSGIPLRAFEIMGTGGFLLTNYQADFLDYFIPGEDFVF